MIYKINCQPNATKHLPQISFSDRTQLEAREKKHTCEKCWKHFSQKWSLKRHLENSCNEITKKCKNCKKLFRLNETVMLREKLNKCFECHKNAENFLNIRKKPFSCEHCNKSYKFRHHLNWHLLSHSDVRPYECKLCDKSFKLNHHLKNHLATHSKEKTYKCKKCEKYFFKEVRLRNHMVTHTGEKPYQCTYCKRSFWWEKSLNNHVLTHTSKKPHQCKQCNKSFTLLHHLKRHLLIHSGKKPHQCARCDKTFTLKEQLKHHFVVAHTETAQGALANNYSTVIVFFFRWFKFTLKPPYSGVHERSLLAIWDTSHWNFFVKFGLRTACDISYDILLSLLKFVNFWRLQGHLSILAKIGCLQKIKVFSMKERRGFHATWGGFR